MKLQKIKLLIDNMSTKEKVGQLSQNIFGWNLYTNKGKEITSDFFNEFNKYGTIGAFYGVLRSDPWSGVNEAKSIPWNERSDVLKNISDLTQKNLNIKPFFVEEVPHGHQSYGATCFPVNLAVGCSFNTELYKDACSLIAKEVREQGANIGLLSCLDLALDPRWGRTEECFGEDTFLAKEMTYSAIVGFQGKNDILENYNLGIVAKHFIGQGSSLGGHNGKTVAMGPNDLKSHHFPIMERAIEANVIGCMAAYNDIDGIPCHGNNDLLNKELKSDMGFNGFVMSDGCAIDNLNDFLPSSEESISKAIKSGVDLDLWNKTFNFLLSALKKELILEKDIDQALERVLLAKNRIGLFNEQAQFSMKNDEKQRIKKMNLNLSKESIVLLKNDNVLPLKSLDDTCLIGPFIDNIYHQLGDYSPFQDLNKVRSLKEVFDIPSARGCESRKESSYIKEAIELAKNNKTVILNIGSSSARDFKTEFDVNGAAIVNNEYSPMDCGEGVDVSEVKISKYQKELFDEIYKVNKNIIVLITSGRPVGIPEISNKAKAIIQSFYGGQETGEAIKSIILGEESPSGRLSISIPYNSAQLPVYYWKRENGPYIDGPSEPLYNFGHGMSYASISVEKTSVKKITETQYEISYTIKNKSNIAAKWPVLIFGKIKGSIIKPPSKQLVYFKKYSLSPSSEMNINDIVDVSWLMKNYKFSSIDFEIS